MSADELATVKKYLVGTEAIALQNQGELGQRLALAQLYNEGAAHVFGRKVRLARLSPDDMNAAADKYFDPKRWAKAVLKAK